MKKNIDTLIKHFGISLRAITESGGAKPNEWKAIKERHQNTRKELRDYMIAQQELIDELAMRLADEFGTTPREILNSVEADITRTIRRELK